MTIPLDDLYNTIHDMHLRGSVLPANPCPVCGKSQADAPDPAPTATDMQDAILNALLCAARTGWASARSVYGVSADDQTTARRRAEADADERRHMEASVTMWRMWSRFVGLNTPPF